MLNYKIYLDNILKSIEKIEGSVKSIEKLNDDLILDATLMRLQTIGENSIKIPKELKTKHKEVRWRNIVRLRNIISHKYSIIDKELIWKFISIKIPLLKQTILDMKNEI